MQRRTTYLGEPRDAFDDIPPRPLWSLVRAVHFVRHLSQVVTPAGYEVALAGSVIKRGWSDHDLDVVLFPTNSNRQEQDELRDALHAFGMRQVSDVIEVWRAWRRLGSDDYKHVEIWKTEDGRRVDLFFLR